MGLSAGAGVYMCTSLMLQQHTDGDDNQPAAQNNNPQQNPQAQNNNPQQNPQAQNNNPAQNDNPQAQNNNQVQNQQVQNSNQVQNDNPQVQNNNPAQNDNPQVQNDEAQNDDHAKSQIPQGQNSDSGQIDQTGTQNRNPHERNNDAENDRDQAQIKNTTYCNLTESDQQIRNKSKLKLENENCDEILMQEQTIQNSHHSDEVTQNGNVGQDQNCESHIENNASSSNSATQGCGIAEKIRDKKMHSSLCDEDDTERPGGVPVWCEGKDKAVNVFTSNGSHFVFDKSKGDIISQILPSVELADIYVPSDSVSTFSGSALNNYTVIKNRSDNVPSTSGMSSSNIETPCFHDSDVDSNYSLVTDSLSSETEKNSNRKDTNISSNLRGETDTENINREEVKKLNCAAHASTKGDNSHTRIVQKNKSSGKMKPISCTSIRYIEPERYTRFSGLFDEDSEDEYPRKSSPVTRSRSSRLLTNVRSRSSGRSRSPLSREECRSKSRSEPSKSDGKDSKSAKKRKTALDTKVADVAMETGENSASMECCECQKLKGNRRKGKSLYGKKKGLVRKNGPGSKSCSCSCHSEAKQMSDNLTDDEKTKDKKVQSIRSDVQDSKKMQTEERTKEGCVEKDGKCTEGHAQEKKEEAVVMMSEGTQVKPADIPKAMIAAGQSNTRRGKTKGK